MNRPRVVVMGVAGCGKSSLSAALARALGVPMIEGDEFHPPPNVEKMRRGIALDDADRAGWLDALAGELRRHPQGAVLACSALKKAYRDRLRAAAPHLRFIHLSIGRDEALARVTRREAHYFNPALVDTQFAALEDPDGEPGVLTLDATQALAALERQASGWLA